MDTESGSTRRESKKTTQIIEHQNDIYTNVYYGSFNISESITFNHKSISISSGKEIMDPDRKDVINITTES